MKKLLNTAVLIVSIALVPSGSYAKPLGMCHCGKFMTAFVVGVGLLLSGCTEKPPQVPQQMNRPYEATSDWQDDGNGMRSRSEKIPGGYYREWEHRGPNSQSSGYEYSTETRSP